MMYELTRDEIQAAMLNSVPQKPLKVELGGGIYYKCKWLSCGETLHRWDRYCPGCGNKLDWSDYDDYFD